MYRITIRKIVVCVDTLKEAARIEGMLQKYICEDIEIELVQLQGEECYNEKLLFGEDINWSKKNSQLLEKMAAK